MRLFQRRLLLLIIYASIFQQCNGFSVLQNPLSFLQNALVPNKIPDIVDNTSCVKSNQEIQQVAKFFTESFWTRKGGKALADSQFQLVYSSQISEFRKSYPTQKSFMTYGSNSNEKSKLFVCRTKEKEICGCIGVQMSTIEDIKNDGSAIEAPVISDVVVGYNFRRMKLAEYLVRYMHDFIVEEWDCNSVYLYVDESNTPAVKLYKKMGYDVISKDLNGQVMRVNESGGISAVSASILCMRKSL